jgi:hypothetical protein
MAAELSKFRKFAQEGCMFSNRQTMPQLPAETSVTPLRGNRNVGGRLRRDTDT